MKRYPPATPQPVLRIPSDVPGFELFFFIPVGMDPKEARTRAFEAVTRYQEGNGPFDDITNRLVSQGFVPVEFTDSPKAW